MNRRILLSLSLLLMLPLGGIAATLPPKGAPKAAVPAAAPPAAAEPAEDAPDGQEIGRSDLKLSPESFICTATNDRGNQQCSITCPTKALAECEDAEGAGAPTCRCRE